jgi:lipopolysaccharide assembly outer membrane protein LptD (OstA)
MLEEKRGKILQRVLILPAFFASFLFALDTWLCFSAEKPKSQPQQQGPSQPEIERQATAPSQERASGMESPIIVLARNWEKREDWIFAQGDVEVNYKDLKLFADQVEVNTKTKDVIAVGNVVIQSPNQVISAEKAFFNMDSREHKLERAYGMIQPNIFYQSETIDGKDQRTFSLTKARLTSCTQPTPRWNFSCSRANFKRDDYIEMWNSVFRIKKIPIFYMPYFRYPLGRERSTGFLMPQIGYAGVKGFVFSESFYWAMARNMDATFDLDYYSSKGLGGGLEYRYLFGDGTGGEARLYYFLFKRGADETKPPNAYVLRLNHNQPLPAGFRLVANVDYQTSFDFLREFDNNFKRASISNYRSEAYVSRSWSYYGFSLRASRFETFFQSIANSIITYYLPQATLNSFKRKLFSPLYFSFNSSFISWKYGWRTEFDNGQEKHYDSVSFNPQLSLPFSSIPWLTIDSSLTTNLVYYAQSYAPNTRSIISEPIFNSNYVVGVEWTGPVFYRIFQSAGGETKVKHLIEPFVNYRYDSPVNDPDRIITSHGFFRYHQLTYGLTNRILVKKDMPLEVLTWGVSQTYYLSPEDSPQSFYKWEGEVPDRSDISSYMRFYPGRKYSLDASTGYNTYSRAISYLRLGASINSYADPFFLSVSWYRSMNPWHRDVLFNRQQIGVVSRFEIPRLQLEALGEFDYNILERKMLYSGISLVYHYQCLDFKADVRIFYYRATPEVQYRVSIGLGNIGKTTDFMGGLSL